MTEIPPHIRLPAGSWAERKFPAAISAMKFPFIRFIPCACGFISPTKSFPAQLSVLFDENTLRYMHYETTYYVVSCLMRAIRSRMQKLPV